MGENMRYIDTLNRNEWIPLYSSGIPEHVLENDGSNPFFSAIPSGKRLVWILDQLPTLEDIPQVELDAAAEATARELFKQQRAIAVSNITVTHNGNTYDGDEDSQTRMGNSIAAAIKLNSTTIPFWVMADNTVVEDLPLDDLEMARALSVVAMANLWLDN